VECWQVVGSGTDLAGVVLAAGLGTRLRPLTLVRPKPLCPVGDRPLVDHAVERVAGVVADIAVNVHHGRAQMEAHLAGPARRQVHVSIEADEPLGTAGALGHLRGWADGRAVVVVNGDTWTDAPLGALLDGWDGQRCRLLVAGREAVDRSRPRLAGAVLPWSAVAGLEAEPSGLWEVLWGAEEEAGRLDWVAVPAAFADCGTPGSYLAANLASTGGRSAIGPGAEVAGIVDASVVWPGCTVAPGERLRRAIRYAEGRTVLVR
jgi:N-acetyl-alpha-D-muramate 1-phosphate uridylyltransferase